MRLLHRFQLHRNVVKGEEFTLEGQLLRRQTLFENFKDLREAPIPRLWINPEIGCLDRGNALSNTQLETPGA